MAEMVRWFPRHAEEWHFSPGGKLATHCTKGVVAPSNCGHREAREDAELVDGVKKRAEKLEGSKWRR